MKKYKIFIAVFIIIIFIALIFIALKKNNDPRARELQKKLNKITLNLENRIKTDDPKISLAREKIKMIAFLTEKKKIEEAEKKLQEFLKEFNCREVPTSYLIGDYGQSLIQKKLKTILRGDICPEYIKEVYYIDVIYGRISDTEKLISQKKFEQAESNLPKLEKMVKNGPIEISEDKKQTLTNEFKEFYSKVSEKYFDYDIEKPLALIENLYTDTGSSIVPYEEIITILNEAKKEINNAAPIIANKTQSQFGKGKLLPPDQGAVFGTWSLDYPAISAKNSLIKKFEDQTGMKIKMDNIPLETQNADGDLQSLDDPTLFPVAGKTNRLKIGPPVKIQLLRTWANGTIPAIEFHLHEQNSVAWHIDGFGKTMAENQWISTQDIIDGKIDDYLARQAEILKRIDKPLMFRTINEFNAYAAIWPTFGKNGRTSIFDVCNGPGSFNNYLHSGKNLFLEVKNLRLNCPEAYNNYGDPNIPDGPERIRDAWKHIHDIFDEMGAANITWTAHTAPEIGSPNPLFEKIAWDKMENYWPGENYIDWGGISGYNQILEKNKNKPNTFYWTAGWWEDEIKKTECGRLPNILYEFSQIPAPQKNDFENWIKALMTDYLPNDFKNIKAVQWIPENLPIENQKELDAFKKYVSENPYWQGNFRYTNMHTSPSKITDLKGKVANGKIILSWTAPEAKRYIIKYRVEKNKIKNNIDFIKKPWRLWSDYETINIENNIVPEKSGTTQNFTISSLPQGIYYFGVQSINNVPYNSRISNIIKLEVK